MFDLPEIIVLLAIMRLLQVPSDVGAAIGIFIVAGNVVVLNPGRVVDHPVLRGGIERWVPIRGDCDLVGGIVCDPAILAHSGPGFDPDHAGHPALTTTTFCSHDVGLTRLRGGYKGVRNLYLLFFGRLCGRVVDSGPSWMTVLSTHSSAARNRNRTDAIKRFLTPFSPLFES